jgi:hypothetical protein
MSVYRLAPYERETVITVNDNDKTARVLTWQRRYQKQLLANPEARIVKEGIHKHSDDKFMEFEIPKDFVKIRNRRMLSPEQKARASDQMRQNRDLQAISQP